MILSTSAKTLEVLKIVVTWPGQTAKEIAEEAGLNEATAKNHLETLEFAKLIRSDAIHGQPQYFSDGEITELHFLAIKAIEKRLSEDFRKAMEVIYGKTGGNNDQ
jgi:predicted transcriptional regulator